MMASKGLAASRPPVVLLVVASSFSPFALTLCVPALPALSEEFGVPVSSTQFVVSIYLLGLALAQPVHGLLADRYGRRPVLLWGFGVFTLVSVACAMADSLSGLAALRFLQALGVATCTVVARAMIRDTSDAEDSARYMAWLAGGMAVAPMTAPMLSGHLIEISGWRASFFTTAGLAVVAFAWLLSSLPETRRPATSVESALKQARNSVAELFKSRVFWGYTLIFGFVNAAFFAFLTNTPLYFSDKLRAGPSLFGYCMGGMALAYICGAFIGSRIIKRRGSEQTLRIGLAGSLCSSGAIAFALLSFNASVFATVAPFLLLFVCTGLVNPPAMAGAVMHHPRQAAAAAGLSNSIAMILSGLASVLAALVYNGDALSVCLPVVFFIALSVLAYLLLARQHAGPA